MKIVTPDEMKKMDLRAVEEGTNVIIGHARYHIGDLLEGRVPCTRLGVGLEEYK